MLLRGSRRMFSIDTGLSKEVGPVCTRSGSAWPLAGKARRGPATGFVAPHGVVWLLPLGRIVGPSEL